MKAVQLLAVYAGVLLVGHSAFGQQSEAERLLTDGDRLAWLKNWQAAEPFFEKAKSDPRARRRSQRVVRPDAAAYEGVAKPRAFGDLHLSRVRLGRPPHKRRRSPSASMPDREGGCRFGFRYGSRSGDWTEALSIAKGLEDAAWVNRATGELGIIGFVQGDYRSGTVKVIGALSQAKKLNSIGRPDSIPHSDRRWSDSASKKRAGDRDVRSSVGAGADDSRTWPACDALRRKGRGLSRSRPDRRSEKALGRRFGNLPRENRVGLRKRSFAGVGEA